MSSTYLQELAEGKIDFAGQQLIDQVARIVLVLTTIISFIVGFALQSLSVTFGIFGASTLILALAVIPPWPMFNKNPAKWLPAVSSSSTSDSKGGK
ncbi:microsomal signal peptidase 12 kDa subunit-domain-containing protein [Crucibulum laeve]|uniref:Signal peptidase complex subunit 1 n=1 Tax=Crucibulum laeve TaxID=68775 RepID=A0A5C3LZS3_9AGAR|nr:microsomal signal peptidase 12 kDa subunit-domain-containing protein [Crucibulum laeve]